MTVIQGITVAIATSGIGYFTRTLLAPEVSTALGALVPPARKTINAGDINLSGGSVTRTARGVVVTLSGGQLSGFVPSFSSVSQGADGEFTLVMTSPAFSCSFTWDEQYNLDEQPDDSPFTKTTRKTTAGITQSISAG